MPYLNGDAVLNVCHVCLKSPSVDLVSLQTLVTAITQKPQTWAAVVEPYSHNKNSLTVQSQRISKLQLHTRNIIEIMPRFDRLNCISHTLIFYMIIVGVGGAAGQIHCRMLYVAKEKWFKTVIKMIFQIFAQTLCCGFWLPSLHHFYNIYGPLHKSVMLMSFFL